MEVMQMTIPIEEIETFVMFWASSGQQLVVTLAVLVAGIVVIQRTGPLVRILMEKKCGMNSSFVTEVVTGYYVALGVILLGIVMWNLGFGGEIVRQVLMALGLTVSALALLLRPYLPKMPFHEGNIIKTGDLVGKVEHVTLLNTRLKTFDGLTIHVPNAKILNDYLINYHSTPTRRVKINVCIKYDQDLVKAKLILEELMVQDPRTHASPRPVVYVTDLAAQGIALGARAWVNNPKLWLTQCDIMEKVHFRFAQEGIQIAYPRQAIQLMNQTGAEDFQLDPFAGMDSNAEQELHMLVAQSGEDKS